MRVHSSITLYFCLLPLKPAMQGSIVCLILGDLGRDYPWESWWCLPLTGSYSQWPMDGAIGWRRHSRQRHEHRMDIASPNKRRPWDARGVSRMLFPSFERFLQEKTLIFHSKAFFGPYCYMVPYTMDPFVPGKLARLRENGEPVAAL